MSEWHIFRGTNVPHGGIDRLPPPPPWRDFGSASEKGRAAFPADALQVEMVNAALYLRRPLLVTGKPGSGKSSLAEAVARELGLGEVLRWNINSRTTLDDGLYSYDAVGRLREAGVGRGQKGKKPVTEPGEERIGHYIRLGPLGTAIATSLPERPRVLLIDEIDKSDIDLPNDLLHSLEEGEFEIPELKRIAAVTPNVKVLTADRRQDVWESIPAGRVRGRAFPFVILTSNGERVLPPAFFRRCLRLDLTDPTEDRLRSIVAAHLGGLDKPLLDDLVKKFLDKQKTGVVATDQLLNALFLVDRGRLPEGDERKRLEGVLLRELEER